METWLKLAYNILEEESYASLPRVLLVKKGSKSLGSVFVFLDIVPYMRALLREGGYSCSFLILVAVFLLMISQNMQQYK